MTSASSAADQQAAAVSAPAADGAGALAWKAHDAQDIGELMVIAFAQGGVDRVFFTSGSDIVFYQEAIAKALARNSPAPSLISIPHEHVSLNAALGYAAVSGKPAVVAVHADVGTQHMGAAMHTASHSRLPVVITAGAPPVAATGTMRGGRDEGGHLWLQQTYDQGAIVRPYVKWDHRLDYQENPGVIASRALQVAMTAPRGPVYLSIPRELSLLPPREHAFPTLAQLGVPRPACLDPRAAREIAARLIAAKNPIVVVGNAGCDPSFLPELVKLCELLGMAAVSAPTSSYLGFPFNQPLYAEAPALREADAVLVVDAAVPWLPGPNAPLSDAYIAVVGVDPIFSRIPTYEFSASLRATADPVQAILAIGAEVRALLHPSDSARCAARGRAHANAASVREQEAVNAAAAASAEKPISPIWASAQIGRLLDDNCILIEETTPRASLRRFLRCSRPGSYLANPGSAGGWAPGAALGAKLAAPERNVIAVSGDGFYMFGSAIVALWAAVQYSAPFLMIVYQNRSYSTGTARLADTYPDGHAVRAGFPGGYFDPPIDFAKEAEAAGAYGENVRDPADVGPALGRAMGQIRTGRPAVISLWMRRVLGPD
jgi:acetolactate synthase-1/2/3 large subunit